MAEGPAIWIRGQQSNCDRTRGGRTEEKNVVSRIRNHIRKILLKQLAHSARDNNDHQNMDQEDGDTVWFPSHVYAWRLYPNVVCDAWSGEADMSSSMDLSSMGHMPIELLMSNIFDVLMDPSIRGLDLSSNEFNENYGSVIASGILAHESIMGLDLPSHLAPSRLRVLSQTMRH